MISRWGALRHVLKYMYAQIGIKSRKNPVLGLLLMPEEWPRSDWSLRSTATLRAAVTGEIDEISLRARECGYVIAMGYYVNDSNLDRLTIRIEPLASAEDAINRVMNFEQKSRRDLESTNRVSQIRAGGDLVITGNSLTAGIQYELKSKANEVRSFKRLAVSIGTVLLVVTFNGTKAIWTWDEVSEVASLQVQKIIDNLNELQS